MLGKSIALNMTITEKNALRTLGILFLSLLVGIIAPICMAAAAVLLIAAFINLFHHSLFGEDAYIYMAFPISTRAMMIGKAITANFWVLAAGMIPVLFLFISAIFNHSEFTSLHAGTLLLVEVLGIFEGELSGYGVANMAWMTVLLLPCWLSRSILICGIFQAAAVVNHRLNPQRNKTHLTVLVVILAVGAYAAIQLLIAVLGLWIFDGNESLGNQLLEMGLEVGIGIGFVAASIKLLERGYHLY